MRHVTGLYRQAGQRARAIASARRAALWSQGEIHQEATELLAGLGAVAAPPDPS